VAGFAGFMMFAVMILQKMGVIFSPPCGLLTMFHVYCPGCGGTRALFSLLKGHFLQSFYYNPAVLLGAALILYYEIAVMVTLVKNNGKIYYYNKPTLVYVYIAVVLGYAVVRDILLVGYDIDLLGNAMSGAVFMLS
jgi:hypothetical protein